MLDFFRYSLTIYSHVVIQLISEWKAASDNTTCLDLENILCLICYA